MSWRPSFEEALAILEIEPDAGVRGAKRAYYLMLQRYGPEPSADMMTRFNGAWEVLQDESVWPAGTKGPPPRRPNEDLFADLEERPKRQLPPGHLRSGRERRAVRSGGPPSIRDHQDIEDLLANMSDTAPAPAPAPALPRPTASTRSRAAADDDDDDVGFGSGRPGTASGSSDVAEALQRLGKSYRQVLDLDRIVASLDKNDDSALASMMSERIEAGHPLAATAAVNAIMDLMVADPTRKWLRPRGVMRVALRLHELGVDDPKCVVAARSVQRTWERWSEAAEIHRGTLDLSTANRLRVATGLSELPDEFPQSLRAALATAGSRGEVRSARPAFEELVANDHEQAVLARKLLGRHAPGLLNDFGDVLPTGRKQAKESLTVQFGLPSWALPSLAFSLLMCVLSFWFFLGEGDSDANASPEHEAARGVICEYLGEGRPGCVWARIISQSIAEEECGLLGKAVPMLEGAVNSPKRRRDAAAASPEQIAAAREEMKLLVGDARALCAD